MWLPEIKKTNIKTYRFTLAAIVAVVMFIVICMRAAAMTITFDEAYTYYEYVRNLNFSFEGVIHLFQTGNSNNHMLNTICIAAVDKICQTPYVEWLIRFPNIFAGGVYLYVCYCMYKREYIHTTAFYCLITGYYINGFFSLARGYGIAVSCLCLCFYFYFSWRNSQFQKIRYAALIMFFYMLACMANTISLLLAPGLGLLCLIQMIRKKSLKRFLLSFWYGIGLTVAGILAMLIYHIRVTDSENEVLYMVESNSFIESFFENYAQMIVGYERWKFAAGLFLLFVCVLGVVCFIMCFSRWMKTEKIQRGQLQVPVFLFLFLSLAALIFLEAKSRGGSYVTGRAMMSFYPLIGLLIEDISVFFRGGKWKTAGSIIASVALALISFSQLSVVSAREFDSEMGEKAYGYQSQYQEVEEYDGYLGTIAHFYEEQANYLREYEEK